MRWRSKFCLRQDRGQVTIRQRKGKVCQIRDIGCFSDLEMVGIGLHAKPRLHVDVFCSDLGGFVTSVVLPVCQAFVFRPCRQAFLQA